jgi:polyhydroxyalkanoate synthase
VAGVVNPANNKKYSYIIGENIDRDSKVWQQSAKSKQGSWWNGWKKWLTGYSGTLAKSIDYDKLKFIELAPGSYVKK